MCDLQRIRKVINWYIFKEYGRNDTEIATKLGYAKSSFSQILGGKVPVSQNFVEKLCSLDGNINKVWVLTGDGNMFRNDDKKGDISNSTIVGANVNGNGNKISHNDFASFIELLKKRDEQIDKLIEVINKLSSK